MSESEAELQQLAEDAAEVADDDIEAAMAASHSAVCAEAVGSVRLANNAIDCGVVTKNDSAHSGEVVNGKQTAMIEKDKFRYKDIMQQLGQCLKSDDPRTAVRDLVKRIETANGGDDACSERQKVECYSANSYSGHLDSPERRSILKVIVQGMASETDSKRITKLTKKLNRITKKQKLLDSSEEKESNTNMSPGFEGNNNVDSQQLEPVMERDEEGNIDFDKLKVYLSKLSLVELVDIAIWILSSICIGIGHRRSGTMRKRQDREKSRRNMDILNHEFKPEEVQANYQASTLITTINALPRCFKKIIDNKLEVCRLILEAVETCIDENHHNRIFNMPPLTYSDYLAIELVKYYSGLKFSINRALLQLSRKTIGRTLGKKGPEINYIRYCQYIGDARSVFEKIFVKLVEHVVSTLQKNNFLSESGLSLIMNREEQILNYRHAYESLVRLLDSLAIQILELKRRYVASDPLSLEELVLLACFHPILGNLVLDSSKSVNEVVKAVLKATLNRVEKEPRNNLLKSLPTKESEEASALLPPAIRTLPLHVQQGLCDPDFAASLARVGRDVVYRFCKMWSGVLDARQILASDLFFNEHKGKRPSCVALLRLIKALGRLTKAVPVLA